VLQLDSKRHSSRSWSAPIQPQPGSAAPIERGELDVELSCSLHGVLDAHNSILIWHGTKVSGKHCGLACVTMRAQTYLRFFFVTRRAMVCGFASLAERQSEAAPAIPESSP